MDNYTKMCAELKELQKGWEPKIGDNTYYKKNKQVGLILEKALIGIMALDFSQWYWLPSLEDLIRMLEQDSGINGLWYLYPHLDSSSGEVFYVVGYGECDCENEDICERHNFVGTPQEALLKLVAYELWDKVWNEDKEAWEEKK